MPSDAMLSEASAEPKKRPYGRFFPGRFARAIVEGKTLAQAAREAGSTSTDDAILSRMGVKWRTHPKVLALLRDIRPIAAHGIALGVERLKGVLEGVPQRDGTDPTYFDESNAFDRLAKIEGLYVTKLQVEHLRPVEFRGFGALPVVIDATPAPLALPASTSTMDDDALRAMIASASAELARRASSPASPESKRAI